MKRILTAGSLMALAVAGGCGDRRPTAPLVNSAFIPGAGEAPSTMPVRQATSQVAGEVATTVPTTQSFAPLPPAHPESIPVMLVPGQYQTIGGVVSEVNGHPIYANKVLRLLRGELTARAPEMTEEQYRKFATDEITRKIKGLERDELIFGAADRSLEGDDRRLAEFLTMQFRTKKITEAGGSVELARRTAMGNGEDFDELIFDTYRNYMTEVYFSKKLYPRIQITADDVRGYYEANKVSEFTELPEVTFRLIKVDSRRAGGRAKALEKAQALAAQAASGDFEALARTQNDDARLARSGGLEVPVQKGAYRLEKVEAAMWTAPVGKITAVIEDSGNFYIAKVESRKEGVVQPFENKRVQERITQTLKSRQFRKMVDQLEKTLRENAMARPDPDLMNSVIEMAMQGYAIWSKPGKT